MEVRLKDLSKDFGKVKAVNNFNLEINELIFFLTEDMVFGIQ